MEIRKPHIKSIPYEEFKDNETLENIAAELNDGGDQLGTQQLTVVADLRYIVLWY